MMKDQREATTHFGYETVAKNEKANKVAGVFDSVAPQYDVMNDLMSLGLHRLWKSKLISLARVKPNDTILDLAGGTADVSLKLAKNLSNQGKIVLADINYEMLKFGEEKVYDNNANDKITIAQVNGEELPFKDNSFDLITIAFGIRNFTDKLKALNSIYKVAKVGAKLLILEFSKPTIPFLNPLYDTYSFNVLPKLGKTVANDADSYKYLAESIRMHENQKDFKTLMEKANWEKCNYLNLSFGIVAIHWGYKL